MDIRFEMEKQKEVILTPWKISLKRFKKDRLSVIAFFILMIIILSVAFGPFIYPYKMEALDLMNMNSTPSFIHPMGTDSLGRDNMARVLYGGRVSLVIAFLAAAVQIFIGTLFGVIAGYYGGIIDKVIMKFSDVLVSMPFLPIFILMSNMLSHYDVYAYNRIYVVMVVIGFLSWPGVCRLIRSQVLVIKGREYMEAAEALGIKSYRKMVKHILPNLLAPVIVASSMGIANGVLIEGSLSYLNFGVIPPVPSWGNIAQAARDMYILEHQWWYWLPPCICIFLTITCINIVGDGLRDALDVKL